MNKSHEIDIGGVPEPNIQESVEGLKNAEVRNLNKEVQQSAVSGAEEINRLVAGVASAMSPIIAVVESNVITETSEDIQEYMEHRANPSVRNADNEFLGEIPSGGLRIGYLNDINGPGAEEVEGFLPTRHELSQLAKYWAKVAIDIEYFWFCYQQTGSTEMRRGPFARRRVARIAHLLGEEVVNRAREEAYAEYGKDQDPRVWNIFLNGPDEERRALREELDRKMQEYCVEAEGSEAGSRNVGDAASNQGDSKELSELNR